MGLDWRLGWGRVIGVLRFSMVIFLEFPVHSVVVERRGMRSFGVALQFYLLTVCGSHLTSLAWLPSMRFRESTFIESRPTTNKDSRFLSRPNQHIHTLAPPPLSPLYHHISKLNPPQTTIRPNPLPFTPTPQSPQHSRKDHPRMSLDRGKPYIRQNSR